MAPAGKAARVCATIPAAGAIAAAGPDFEAAGPDFEAAGPDCFCGAQKHNINHKNDNHNKCHEMDPHGSDWSKKHSPFEVPAALDPMGHLRGEKEHGPSLAPLGPMDPRGPSLA